MMSVGDYVWVKIPVEGQKITKERRLKVVYIHPLRRWFAVEVPAPLGTYRTCYMMPHDKSPMPEKQTGRKRMTD